VGGWALTTAILLVTLFCVAWIAPSLFGFSRYVITGGSMSGTFERGSLVFETRVPVGQLHVGDIITYLPPEGSGVAELVTHRIISITEPEQAGGHRVLRTQGDANDSPDPWTFTLSDAVQPRVQGWIPQVGWVFIALTNPVARTLAIGVPAAFIALLFLRDLVREFRRPRAADTTEPAPVAP
jgi:signal peptidase I